MIIYKARDTFSPSYDRVYRANPQHFTHKATFKAIDALIAGDKIPGSCLDIGCGQGQVLAYIADIAKKHRPGFDGHRFVGIDFSGVAVDQSNAAYPELGWAVDRYEHFVVSDWFSRCFPDGIDLIVNKGGFTSVENEETYIETLERTNAILNKGGHYLLAMNKAFYEQWSEKRGWSRGALDITADIFGEMTAFPINSYYAHLYAKRA